MDVFCCHLAGFFLYLKYCELQKGSFSKTELFCSNEKRPQFLKHRVNELLKSSDYTLPPFCVFEYHGQLQTVYQFVTRNLTRIIRSTFISSCAVFYDRELLVMSDGGTIALDWAYNFNYNCVRSISNCAPVIILHHGLVGDSQSEYIYHMAWQLLHQGYRVVVLVARGCGGLKLTSAAIFAGRRTDDVSAGINHVKHLYPNSKLFLVGFSLGAALSLQYLAEGHTEEHRSGIAVVNQNPLTAALCVCPPWNVTRDTFEAGWITSVWMTFLAVPLKAYYLTHRTYLRKVAPDGVGGISLWELFWARNVSAFDQLFHRTHFRACGNMYECVRDYYDDVSPVHSAPCITTPTVVLTPRDDPLCKHSHAPTDPDSLGAGLVVVKTPYGGHLAFPEGLLPLTSAWTDRFVVAWFNSFL